MKLHNKEPFEIVFKKYYLKLCHIAYGYIPDAEVCEDVVQEAFIAAWEKQKDTLEEKELYAYLVRCVRNGCISWLRKEQKNSVITIEDSGVCHTESHQEHLCCEEEKHPEDILHEILQILPERCREIYLMSKLHSMKYRDIAGQLNLSEKTIENQMGKAIKLLRQYAATHSLPFIVFLLIIHLFIQKW